MSSNGQATGERNISTTKVVIIGGGLAGLAAACEAAVTCGDGRGVTIIERNAHLGGKMNLLRDQGFSFDMGPTIITLPQVLRGIIARAGKRVEDYIKLVRLDPQWRCFFDDGAKIDLRDTLEQTCADLSKAYPGTDAASGFKAFVEYSRRMYSLSEKVFFYKDLGGVGDMMRLSPLGDPKLLGDVLAMRLHSTVGATAHGMIREPHVRQLTEHFLQYVGSSPFLAPAILSLIAAAQVDHGCWYAYSPDGKEGGTRNVARSLERLARDLGVNVITGVGVRRIVSSGRRATGVELDDGRSISCDAVVSNCDVQRTLRDLVGTPEAKRRQQKIAKDYSPACSGVVLYLGLKKRYEQLAHHNFLFSRNSHEEFEDIYARGVPAKDPTLYLAVPSRSGDETQAPPGGEALYVLIHTPYLRPGQRWEGAGGLMEQYRPVVMEKLRACGAASMPDIDSQIVCEHQLHPGLIDKWYNAEGGAIYGLASHGRLKGGFKPRNRSMVLDNVYLAGGSANPGPGVPMVLMSGVTAARSLAADSGWKEPAINGTELKPLSRDLLTPAAV